MPRLLLSCALFVSILGLGGVSKIASASLAHGILWYGTAPNDSVRALTAKRYSTGVTGKNEWNDFEKVQIKALNPQFRWYVYNSGTDNYVPPGTETGEYDALRSLAIQKGWDPEIAYLHYWDDTWVVLEGDTLLLPGWGGGSATDPAQSRIPVYYKNLTRRLCNFSTPQAAALYRQTMVSLAFDTPFEGSTLYPDGIFLDNTSARLFNYGRVLSGGHVRETSNQLLIESADFQEWWWTQNLAPYLTSLKDTLQTSATWSHDHQRKYLMINVSNDWTDEYASRDAADVLCMEFQYNPVRNPDLTAIEQSYHHDVLASRAGINSFYMATSTRTVSGHAGSYSLSEIMLGNLCWFLLTRTSNSIFYQQGTNSPSTAGWDSLTWIGAMDVADTDLGEAVAPPYVLATGVDPLGNPYAIHARQYQNGLVVLRNRGSWDEGIEVETAVTVPLPDTLKSVSADGKVLALATSVTLRNGQGALFLSGTTLPLPLPLPPPPPPPPGDSPPPVNADAFSFLVTRDYRKAIFEWETPSWADSLTGFDVFRQDTDTTMLKINRSLIPPRDTSFVDVPAPWTETSYWMVLHLIDGRLFWSGPFILQPDLPGNANTTAIVPILSQNVPNPARAGDRVDIHFAVGHEGSVRLEVFDLAGRRVALLRNEFLPPGTYSDSWDAWDERGIPLAPGVYFYRLQSADGTLARKLLIMR